MPVVKSTDHALKYQLGLVCSGDIKVISAYVSDDDGGSVSVLLSKIHASGKPNSEGLKLVADLHAPGGYLPKGMGSGKQVKVHL